MKTQSLLAALIVAGVSLLLVSDIPAADAPPKNPAFSLDYLDRSVEPGVDFYRYADGTWLKDNPVPPDKSRWGAFGELDERNWFFLHEILESSKAAHAPTNSVVQKVGDFYRSATDTNLLEKLGFQPLQADLKQIDELTSAEGMMRLLAEFHQDRAGAFFSDGVSPDEKNSSVYAFQIGQGGLGLPDRDYYLQDSFAKQREAYTAHIARMFTLLGEKPADAKTHAATILDLETALAKASKPRVDLRDPIANYHKVTVSQLVSDYPDLPLNAYLSASGLDKLPDLVVGQPEFLAALDKLVKERPLADWKTYLRWHLLHTAAPYLHAAAETESFAFYGTVLSGQPRQEPRWQRAGRVINASIGEALGQLFVEKHFPPAARARMIELVGNLKAVFHDRLVKVDWVTEATRAKALAKFDRFTQKIGYPNKFRDYSSVEIRPDDYLGNVRRAARFESRRELARVGQPVDKSEWHMTPPTVNAYFNQTQNEIVFPAGILQPPFFDMQMDDAVNYGAIGVVIGHEITHGFDDQGRKYDADGNLADWWTDDDAKAFEARAQKVVDQYNSYIAIPEHYTNSPVNPTRSVNGKVTVGDNVTTNLVLVPALHVNGKLTLGENLADLGGTSIAYEALQRVLAKDPAKRKSVGGFTPEQRFFLSLSQIWRTNCREAELRRLITVDGHSPGQFRAIGPHVNMQEFFDAFGIKDGAPMWRAPELRAKIW